MKIEKPEDLIRYFLDKEDEGDEASFAATDLLVPEGCVFHYPDPLSTDVRGPEKLKRRIAAFRGAFPDMNHIIGEIFSAGSKVVGRFKLAGTHKGEFMGIAPTGNKIVCNAIWIAEVENMKFRECWVLFDTLELLLQIGAIDLPGQIKKCIGQ